MDAMSQDSWARTAAKVGAPILGLLTLGFLVAIRYHELPSGLVGILVPVSFYGLVFLASTACDITAGTRRSGASSH